jgi:hypothetical protein
LLTKQWGTVSDGSLCSRSSEGDLAGEVGVGVDGVGVREDSVNDSSGRSSAGGMATESSSGGIVGRLVDGNDRCGDKDGGVQQERGGRRRLDSLIVFPQELGFASPLDSFSRAFGWWGIWRQ